MPTQPQVQQLILSAQWKRANLVNNRLTALTAGFKTYYEIQIRQYRYLIAAVTRQYQLGDYVSTNFLIAYDCLSALVGIDTSVNTIDPNYQGPNIIIDVTTPPGIYNSARIPFSNTTTPEILNYNTGLKSVYGPNPDVLIFLTTGGVTTPDYSTAPIYTYVGDSTSDIVSIIWQYPSNVSGYIQIGGSPG